MTCRSQLAAQRQNTTSAAARLHELEQVVERRKLAFAPSIKQ